MTIRYRIPRRLKSIDELFATRRFCYFIPIGEFVEGQGYRAAIVFEGEPAYYPTGDWPYEGRPEQKLPWFWGPTYEAACVAADRRLTLS